MAALEGMAPDGVAAPDGTVRWLDLCCGRGTALLETAALLGREGLTARLTGVDLVDAFAAEPPQEVEFFVAPLADWRPAHRFDLITCVHGLHYVGDKLGALARAVSWLTTDGHFVANFDTTSIRFRNDAPATRRLTTALRAQGFTYDARARRVSRHGHADVEFGFRYLGADDRAGPNYTGQPAVHSYYER